MTTPVSLEERVTILEAEMAEVRFSVNSTLVNHTRVLNAIREDQNAHGERLNKVETRLTNVETEMRSGFAKVDQRFGRVEGEMRNGFGKLAEGQARITELLTQHIEECDKG